MGRLAINVDAGSIQIATFTPSAPQIETTFAITALLEPFRFRLHHPLPRPATQRHRVVGGRAGEWAGRVIPPKAEKD